MSTAPVRPADTEARALAQALIAGARFGALAVRLPETGAPYVSRVAVGTDAAGRPVTLVSTLAQHTTALRADPACSLLLGEPDTKGDPLTHPRLTLQARADFVAPDGPDHALLRARWLETHPKAALYVDFADFGFLRFAVAEAFLNGGFGKAFALGPDDLA